MAHSRVKSQRRGVSGRAVGVGAAVVLSVVVVGGLGVFVWRGAAGGVGESIEPPPAALLGQGERGETLDLVIADKNDPTRAAARLIAARMEPVDGDPSTRRVEKPNAWIYFEDGRRLLITSDRGRFYVPPGQSEPRSGRLEGDVRARLYAPTAARADGTPEDIDPAVTEPVLSAAFEEPVRFDLELARLESPGRVRITSAEVEALGSDVWVVLNERRERIERLEIRKGERITYTPRGAGPGVGPGGELEVAPEVGPAGGEPAVGAAWGGGAGESATERAGAEGGAGPAAWRLVQGTPANEAAVDEPAAVGPRVEHYLAIFEEDVRAEQAGRVIRSDRLDVWARTVDNKIQLEPGARGARAGAGRVERLALGKGGRGAVGADGGMSAGVLALAAAIGQADGAAGAVRPGSAGAEADAALGDALDADDAVDAVDSLGLLEDGAAAAETPAEGGDGSGGDGRGAGEPVTLYWTGPLTLTPLSDVPGALAADELALRFVPVRNPLVEFEDSANGATGRAHRVEYAATRRQIDLSSEVGGVELAAPRSGTLRGVNRLSIQLPFGLAHVTGQGVLTGAKHVEATDALPNPADPTPPPEARPQRVSWGDQAAFEFALDETGRMTDRLTRATFDGNIKAEDARAVVTGRALDAAFVDGADGNQRVDRVDVTDASAIDGRGAGIVGRALSLFLDEPVGEANSPEPTRLIARGGVRAARDDGAFIQAEFLDARLARDERGDLAVAILDSQGAVTFDDARAAKGEAARLHAEVADQLATLEGPGAAVSQDGARITGDTIDLDGEQRRIRVAGAGTFDHALRDRQQRPARVNAAWTEGMAFDDLAGTLACEGGVVAVSETPGVRRDTLKAARLDADIGAAAPGASEAGDTAREGDAGEGSALDDRPLRRATLVGGPNETGAVVRASVESRRYAAVPDAAEGPRLVGLAYVEGETIHYDNEAGVLHVPTAGRMLLLDERAEGAGADAASGAANGGGTAADGRALFTWATDMRSEQASRRVVFVGDVRVRHRAQSTGRATLLNCERLDATFAPADAATRHTPAESGDPASFAGDLVLADATGRVAFTSGERYLNADRVRYDAERGVAEAWTESPGGEVVVQETNRGVVARARSIVWDLKTDRIDVRNLAPTSVPR